MSPWIRRQGITIVEVLVVITVIAVLLALLVPAVFHAREAARRTQCTNNMKQQSLGVLTFESRHRHLPQLNYGYERVPSSLIFHAVSQAFSWRTRVLPFVEQQTVFDLFDFDQDATDLANQPAVSTVIPTFVCPARLTLPRRWPTGSRYLFGGLYWREGDELHQHNWERDGLGRMAAAADYAAVVTDFVHRTTVLGDEEREYRFEPGAWGAYSAVFEFPSAPDVWNRPVRLAEITDGASQTLLLAENAGGPDIYVASGLKWNYEDSDLTNTNQFSWAVAGGHMRGAALSEDEVNQFNSSIYSFHTDGANCSFADGSVHFISEGIAADVLHALITREGNEIVERKGWK